MGVCDLCGNEYDKSFEVIDAGGVRRTFDSFECAIEVVAPRCRHCECRIIGHGVQAGDHIYCCAHCARHSGVDSLQDRAPG
jgi:hypothetical protein